MADAIDPFNEGLEGKGKYYPMIVLSNKKLLIDDTFSDLTIKIGNETVNAHAGIVCCRCEEIIGFPQDDKKKASKKKLEVKVPVKNVVSAAIMNKVLEYLYTGMVDFPKVSDEEILHLIGAARHFKLDRLTYLCERWLREHMTIESVFHLLKAATDLKEERVKGFCLQFALGHYNEFISNKDGIYILGIELFQEVVAAFQNSPTPPKEMNPEDNPDTLLEDFKKMYELMPYSDITFQIRGEPIKAHKAVLAAHSDAFVSTIFKDESGIRTSPEAFRNMLRFTYFGDDQVNPLPACELVEFSRRYKLPSLLRICEDKIRASVAMDTVLPILAIAYLPAEGKQDLVDELKSKCFPFILQNLPKIDLAAIKASNPLMIVDLLLELQTAWKSGKYGLGKLPPGFSSNLNAPSPGNHASHSNSPSSMMSSSFEKAEKKGPTVPSRSRGDPSNGNLLGAQRRGPAPPPRTGPAPPPRLKPPPSPRNSTGAPPPPARNKASSNASMSESSEDGAPKKISKKDKKEEERRKKEEAKRIQKEKKERLKMEKKFKPKGKEIH